jgi:hypothetical protein
VSTSSWGEPNRSWPYNILVFCHVSKESFQCLESHAKPGRCTPRPLYNAFIFFGRRRQQPKGAGCLLASFRGYQHRYGGQSLESGPTEIPPVPAACFRAAWKIQTIGLLASICCFTFFDSIIALWKQGSPERHVQLPPQSNGARWRVSSP